MWECGLKQFAGGEADHPVGGHSLCGSVDWNLNEMPYLRIHAVTPYVGVWIETLLIDAVVAKVKSLLMWECGLKLSSSPQFLPLRCHSLCGSVDWNFNF